MGTPKEESVEHLNRAKGEIDAAWSALHGEGENTASILIADLGRHADDVTNAVEHTGGDVVECNVCHKEISPDEPCYQLRLGSIEADRVTFLPHEDVGYYHQLCLVGLP